MLTEKIIVVVGGAGLLGSEFVSEIIRNNGIAVIADNNAAAGKTLSDKINKDFGKGKAFFKKTDFSSSASVNSLISSVDSRYGRIDGWINAAYPKPKNYGKEFLKLTFRDFNSNINLHLGGYFICNQLAVKYFLKQGFGNIINLASIYGFLSPRFEIYGSTGMTMPVDYALIKAGILQLTRYLANYLKGKNIRINSISPGGVLNGQQKEFVRNYSRYTNSNNLLKSTDINGTVIFLLSGLSGKIHGQNIIVDDGFSL